VLENLGVKLDKAREITITCWAATCPSGSAQRRTGRWRGEEQHPGPGYFRPRPDQMARDASWTR